MPAVWVYALLFEPGRFYIGMTADLDQRLTEHKRRQSPSIKRFKGDFVVIYKKSFPTYGEARKHEKFLKSGGGRTWLKSIRM